MQYERYHFYNDGVEMIIPSSMKKSSSRFAIQNSFISGNKRVAMNVARGRECFKQEQLGTRMDEYCKGFARDVSAFECIKISTRRFLNDSFVDLRYFSDIRGYQFYNAFILGIYGGRELIVTMQCEKNAAAEQEHIFDTVADSIRILNKERNA